MLSRSAPVPASTTGSGQYYTGSSASSGGRPVAAPSYRDGPIARRVEKKKNEGKKKGGGIPGINQYLAADEQYQQDRAALIRNFRNLRAANIENRGNLAIDKDITLARLREEQSEAQKNMAADFAARGLFGGAEYLNKENDRLNDALEERQDARTSFRRNTASLLRDLLNARSLKNENIQQARLEAIRRRAAEYGIQA